MQGEEEVNNMISMTFGNMPTFEQFEKQFDEVVSGNKYRIRNCKVHGNSDYTCRELYDEVKAAVEGTWDTDNENSRINVASSIMYTLGFEWI
jgi:hypothetical protein